MKKKNLLAVTAVAAALLLTGCGVAASTTALGDAREPQTQTETQLSEAPAETEKEVKTEKTEEQKPESKKLTQEEAKEKAVEAAKVDVSTLYDVETEFDDGVYEIEFSSEGTEYNYKIDPSTGAVLSNYTEVDDDYVEARKETKLEAVNVTLEEAKKIAYKHAGVSESSLYDVEGEYDDGVYEIKFSSKGTEYDYKVSRTGEVLKYETDRDDDYFEEKEESKPAAEKISLAEAKKIAYKHAGVSESSLYDVEGEYDDGVYEIEFSSKGTEYDYKVSRTGEVLKYETDRDDDYFEEKEEVEYISKSEAKSIALSHAGVKADEIRDYEIELDDGVYEISFEKGRTEFEYEIKASTGKILDYEKEIDD